MKARGQVSAAFALIIALTMSACSSVSVNQDFDTSYDFTGLRTYAWLPVTVSVNVGELKARRFMTAVDNELATLGYQKTTEDADFLVNVHGATQQQTDVTSYGYGYGRWGGGAGGVDVDTYTEGTLILDFVDGQSKEMFWRGTANAIVDPGQSAEKQEAKFASIAQQMLAEFPPN